ncbi:hypothetical protein GGQ06_002666 [Salinibacter ruber]|nr:hypothetical protein [Salinibacter ruber]
MRFKHETQLCPRRLGSAVWTVISDSEEASGELLRPGVITLVWNFSAVLK